MKYSEWMNDNSISKEWMSADDFFLGVPLNTDKAPVDEVMRATIYDYIYAKFGNRRLSLGDADVWADLFRARLMELNGAFWKQVQMDILLNVKDMVTADYVEYIKAYNRGLQETEGNNSQGSTTDYTTTTSADSNTEPIVNTVVDNSKPGKVTATSTPTAPARNVSLHSNLAESSYIDPVVDGDGPEGVGMPMLDTTHGDTASGGWQISEAVTMETEAEANSGTVTSTQGAVETDSTSTTSAVTENETAGENYSKMLNAAINGSLREGSRDYNGYNLTASIDAVQVLLPLTWLRNNLSDLFYGIIEL